MVRQRRPLAGPQITEMLAVKKPTVLIGSEPSLYHYWTIRNVSLPLLLEASLFFCYLMHPNSYSQYCLKLHPLETSPTTYPSSSIPQNSWAFWTALSKQLSYRLLEKQSARVIWTTSFMEPLQRPPHKWANSPVLLVQVGPQTTLMYWGTSCSVAGRASLCPPRNASKA